MFDVFLGGTAEGQWRDEFKSGVSSDISIFDPKDCDTLDELVADTTARELYHLEECNTLAFNLLKNEPWKVVELLPTMIMMTDSIGRGLQVIVCYDDQDKDFSYLKLYFEFNGVHTVNSLEDLITSIEENVAQLEMCGIDEDLRDV